MLLDHSSTFGTDNAIDIDKNSDTLTFTSTSNHTTCGRTQAIYERELPDSTLTSNAGIDVDNRIIAVDDGSEFVFKGGLEVLRVFVESVCQ